MIPILLILVGVFLLVVSVIDWKFRALPSIFLTAILFVVAVLNPSNLWFGIMTFLVALLLYEADFFSGIADIKVMTTIGFLLTTTNYFFGFILLTVIFGFMWKVFIKWRLPKEKNVAFLPVFLFIYYTLLILGGFT